MICVEVIKCGATKLQFLTKNLLWKSNGYWSRGCSSIEGSKAGPIPRANRVAYLLMTQVCSHQLHFQIFQLLSSWDMPKWETTITWYRRTTARYLVFRLDLPGLLNTIFPSSPSAPETNWWINERAWKRALHETTNSYLPLVERNFLLAAPLHQRLWAFQLPEGHSCEENISLGLSKSFNSLKTYDKKQFNRSLYYGLTITIQPYESYNRSFSTHKYRWSIPCSKVKIFLCQYNVRGKTLVIISCIAKEWAWESNDQRSCGASSHPAAACETTDKPFQKMLRTSRSIVEEYARVTCISNFFPFPYCNIKMG